MPSKTQQPKTKLITTTLFLTIAFFSTPSLSTDFSTQASAISTESGISHRHFETEVRIKGDYVKTLGDLRRVVIENYESSWWKPSLSEITNKIDVFLEEFRFKRLAEYTEVDINELSEKIDRLRLVLSDNCEKALDEIQLRLDVVGKKAMSFTHQT